MKKLIIKNYPYSDHGYRVYACERDTVPGIGDVVYGSEEQCYTEVSTHVFKRYIAGDPYDGGDVYEIWTDVHEFDVNSEKWEKTGNSIMYVWVPYQED